MPEAVAGRQRAAVSLLREDSERGFIARFTVLAALLLVLPWLAFQVLPRGLPISLVPPAVAAVLVIGASVWRPREALLAFAFFVLVYDTLAMHMGLQIKRFDELAAPGLALVGAARAMPRWRAWVWWPREIALGLAVLAGVASSLVNGVPLEIWGIQLGLLLKAIVIFYVALWTGARRFEIAAGMKVALWFGVFVLVLGVAELFNPPLFQKILGLQEFISSRGPLFSVKSIFVHPVLFSWFTAFIALYAWAWYLVDRRRVAWLVAAAFSFGPFLGQRRRAILALLGGLAAALFEAIVRRRTDIRAVLRRFAVTGATMAVILMLFIPMLGNLWNSTIQNYIAIPSLEPGDNRGTTDDGEAPPQVRIALYIGSAEVARDMFPFGGGLGRWGSWMSRQHYSDLYYEYGVSDIRGLRPERPVNATDTFWPQILGELGVPGFLAYVGFMACLGIGLWRASARYRDGLLRIFTLGTGMIFVQALIESSASAMFHSPPRAYLTFVVIGVATSLLIAPPEDSPEQPASPQPISS